MRALSSPDPLRPDFDRSALRLGTIGDGSARRHLWSWWAFATIAILVLLSSWNAVGPSFIIDDLHFFEAARNWIDHPPYVGTTHWGLRHAIVLPLASLMRLLPDQPIIFYLLPVAYFLVFFAIIVPYLRNHIGTMATFIAMALFVATPVVRDYGGRVYPDFIEMFWVALALIALHRACEVQSAGKRRGILFASGAAAAMALLTRETCVWIVLFYAYLLFRGRPISRSDMLMVALGAAPLLFADWLFLFLKTGDIFYRFHIITSHVDIPSTHMVGGVYHGRVFLNPDLAARWTVDGPVYVHWSINPLIYFFIDLRYAFFWWAALMIAIAGYFTRSIPVRFRGQMGVLASLALLAYAFPTYVLMISQRPRYYLFSILCVAIITGIIGSEMWRKGIFRRALAALVVLQILAMIVSLDMTSPRMHVPWLAARLIPKDGGPVHVDQQLYDSLTWVMPRKAFDRQVRTTPAPVGGYRLDVQELVPPRHAPPMSAMSNAGCWATRGMEQQLATGPKRYLIFVNKVLGNIHKRSGRAKFRVLLQQRLPDSACSVESDREDRAALDPLGQYQTWEAAIPFPPLPPSRQPTGQSHPKAT
jgi:Dolichyl-phosphate-mannose-protein mannosyltransferase